MKFPGRIFRPNMLSRLKIYCFSRPVFPDGFFYAQNTKQEVLYGSS